MSKEFVITFGGDTSLGDYYVNKSGNRDLMQRLKNHPESFFEGIKPIVANSDYFILNLETVLANEPSVYIADKKYPNWDKPEPILEALSCMGVTAVNLANNHTMDFGPKVMLKTKALLEENGVHTFGAGDNVCEAERPLKVTLFGENGIKNIYIFAGMRASKRYREIYDFFASNDEPGINSLSVGRISEQIKNIRKDDPDSFIILFPHWQGIDYKWASENKGIGEICSQFIECGVNCIIGHGPHIINHFETRDSAAIAYSIGNFVWNAKGRYQKLQAPPYSAIGRLHFKEEESDWRIESRFYPIVTDNTSTDYQSRAITENEFENLIEVLTRKDDGVDSAEAPNNFGPGKDSIGYYISAYIADSKRDFFLHDKDTDELSINYTALQKANDYENQTFSTAAVLAQEFEKKGYPSTRMENILIVQLGQRDLVFIETESSFCSSVGARIAKDKTLAREFLKKAGLNIIEGKGFKIHQKKGALKYALSLPASVVKPADGNRGRGISVGVKTQEEFENAWNSAAKVTNSKILVEEQFMGATEARYLVVGGRCVAVHLRIPPNVVGNGISTIEELIEQKNEIRLRNPDLNHCLLKMDKHRLSIINAQGYNLASIPDKGTQVIIDWKGGISSGGDSMDLTDTIHPLYKEIAEKAAAAIPGLDVVGVDILAYNHFQEPDDNNHIIVEVNTRPGIGPHLFPSYGKPRNVAKDIADYCIGRALQERTD